MPSNVRPKPRRFNLGNSCLVNAVVSGYNILIPSVRPNLNYLLVGKFGLGALGAFVSPAKINGIPHVSSPRIPSQVLEAVVCSVAVYVAAVKLSRHWLIKSRKNEAVDAVSSRIPAFINPDLEIAELSLCGGHDKTPRYSVAPSGVLNSAVKASYPAFVGNLIERLKAWNVFPNFVHVQSPLVDARKKLHSNQYGNRLSGATLAMQGAL